MTKKKKPQCGGGISRPSLRKGERINIYIYLFDVARCAALRKVQSARIDIPWANGPWIYIFIYRALRAHRLVVYIYYIIPRHISKRYVGVKCARADIYNIYKTYKYIYIYIYLFVINSPTSGNFSVLAIADL